ncbi:MAG: NADH-quinone oxidoreductase subunit NuoN [Candidatus Thermoplasmatota archaeon]|nr:NADH-quinone oxidoreductase subunit NuoN [Candidatus Thermoplasmatota archaeon]
MTFDTNQLAFYYPMLVLGAAGFIILALGIKRLRSIVYATIAMAAFVVAFILLLMEWYNILPYVASEGMVFNGFGFYFALLFLVASGFITYPALKNIAARSEIFYAMLLFVSVGMIVAAFSYNLITLFISFEAVSIGTYIIAGFHKTKRTLESATKYFFTGTVATAFIIFGLSYFYLSTGTFSLLGHIAVSSTPDMLIALAFLTIGFGFKMAIFPMHQWAIDTYDGTENSVSSFLSTGSKLVAFVIMLKVFIAGFAGLDTYVYVFFAILAVATMTYANISALSQNNLKRLLAYSSVAQAGYLILVLAVVGYAPGTQAADYAIAAGMLYSLVYIFMKGGAFLTMNIIRKDSPSVDDISGLGRKSPGLALAFSIILLSLAGIPLTGGFLAKFFLFLSLVQGGLWWLAVVAILNSAISVFYYFRIMMFMYWRDSKEDSSFDLSVSNRIPVYFSALVVVALFFTFSLFFTILPFAGGVFGGL